MKELYVSEEQRLEFAAFRIKGKRGDEEGETNF